jgi:hypothetical protein
MKMQTRALPLCCFYAAMVSCAADDNTSSVKSTTGDLPIAATTTTTTTTTTATTTARLSDRVPDSPPGAFFPQADEQLLGRYGGIFIPTGEGPIVRIVPVDGVMFAKGQVLTDDDFAAVFPAIQRMDPYRLSLRGHDVSDEVVDLLNRLRSLKVLDLSGTKLTRDGLRRLRIKTLIDLRVPGGQLTEADRAELRRAMAKVTIHE